MRNYKNYDVSENDLQKFLRIISDLQCEIKGSSLIREDYWRMLLLVDSSDEEILDRTLRSFGLKDVYVSSQRNDLPREN